MAIRGQLTVGVVVALTAYLGRLYGPLTAMSNVQVDVMTALVSFERVLEVLDLEPTVAEKPDAIDLRAREGEERRDRRARRASASATRVPTRSRSRPWSPSRPCSDEVHQNTLDDVSFTVPAGHMVALVGHSGAGKTTISQLVTRMYDPTAGAVRIAGADLRDVTQASLRATVGVVSQEAHLFHDTIAENLRYARPEATDADIERALEQAHIADLVATPARRHPHRRRRPRLPAVRRRAAAPRDRADAAQGARTSSSSTRPPRTSTPARRPRSRPRSTRR